MPTITDEMRARAREKAALPRLRSEWLNLHLGGFHWIHNDLTDWNLKAVHDCPTCRGFRQAHFRLAKVP